MVIKSGGRMKLLLGISGGIAAYKSLELTRLCRRAGWSVKVVMTEAAQAFVTPLSFQALSGQPVASELLFPDSEAAMSHIELARWADLVLIAPASANIIAKIAAGLADDLLSTLCLASAVPLMLAPAMNQQMWSSSITQENIEKLKRHGVFILPVGIGDQACGEVGPGRMLEASEIFAALETWQASHDHAR